MVMAGHEEMIIFPHASRDAVGAKILDDLGRITPGATLGPFRIEFHEDRPGIVSRAILGKSAPPVRAIQHTPREAAPKLPKIPKALDFHGLGVQAHDLTFLGSFGIIRMRTVELPVREKAAVE